MDKVLLSIIVPVFDCEMYLPKCIESILNQTFSDYELILVNDGSTDSSGKICERYANAYANVRYVNKENEGACYARLAGIRIARGSYLGFVDGDDWIDENMYETLMEYALQNQADIVTSGFVFDDGLKVLDAYPEGVYQGDALSVIFDSMIYKPDQARSGMLCSVCTKIFRKKLVLKSIEKVPPNVRVWEDLAYVYLSCANANCIQITHNTFYHYIQHADSTSHKKTADIYRKMAYSFKVTETLHRDCSQRVKEQLMQLSLHCLAIFFRNELADMSLTECMRMFRQKMREWEIESGAYLTELYTKMNKSHVYIEKREKLFCARLVSQNFLKAWLQVRGENWWRTIEFGIRKKLRPLKRWLNG